MFLCTSPIIDINTEIKDFFIEKCTKDILSQSEIENKAYLLVAYTYNWFFGLRNKSLEEQIITNNAEIMEFLENIWKCYGDLSIEELQEMQDVERNISRNPYKYIRRHYYDLRTEDIYSDEYKVIGNITKLELSTMKLAGVKIGCYFHSMENEEIGDYLPPNVTLRLSKDGLPEIVKLTS